ncbi:phage terminase small subunit P27 family [Methylorubrum populi]|uniref:phage terminase small subunit P27 family n=1 Tax=Methylorubrum populi TaxID=223967 RepID=UPI0031F91AA6
MTVALAIPRPPAWLSPAGKREWRRVAPILTNERRTLDPADLAAFASYCAAVEQVEQASREIAANGYTYKSKTKDGELIKANPAVAIRDKAMTQVRLLAAELGMTSASRARAQTRSDGDDDGLFD